MRWTASVRSQAAALRAAAFIVVGLGLGGLVGCGDPLVTGGSLHFGAGRYDQAARVFEQAVAKNPNDAIARIWLARSYSELGRIPEAVQEYDRAVALDPALEPQALAHRQRYWRQQYLRGESFLRDALAPEAGSAPREQSLAQAAAALQNAAGLAPQQGMTYFQLYRLDMARADTTGAERNLKLALSRADQDREVAGELSPVLRQRGQTAGRERRFAAAVEAYDAAARLTPDDVDLLMDLAAARIQLAEQADTPAAARDSEYRQAGLALRRVCRLRPTDPDALFNLATVESRTGQAAAADSLIRSYLALKPVDADAYRLLARVAAEENRTEAARTADLAAQALGLSHPVGKPSEWARRAAEKFGPGSDLGRSFAAWGAPDRIHTVQEASDQSLVEVWFYFAARRVAAFRDGRSEGALLKLGGSRR